MKPSITRSLIVAGALLVLGGVNYSIFGKERIIASGATIFLELAPVDPRSIMQGDYMTLRFQVAERIAQSRSNGDNSQTRVPLQVTTNRVATFDADPGAHSLWLRYRLRRGEVWLGTNAYFFAEGSASRYASARYGEFRVDARSGDAVLVGMRDEHLRPL
jgi:uncharacterized membrane-anchored protein